MTFTSPRQDPLQRISPAGWTAVAALAALFVLAFRVPIAWMVDRWVAPESYYSHGFIVPLVALYVVWRDRFELAARPFATPGAGLFVMLAGLLMLFVFGWLTIFSPAAFAMIFVVWGLCGFLFGWPVFKRLAFAAFILTFMVPLPLAIIEKISFAMKMLAGTLALKMIGLLGITAINDGATILLGDAAVTVGNACSGLRSLISLIFLGLLFAYLSDLTPARRAILFAASIPIALISNVLRVFFLCMVAYRWGDRAIEGTVHDVSGYMIFVIAFVLLYATARALGWNRGDGGGGSAGEVEDAPPRPAGEPAQPIPARPRESTHA
ncbi:MAG TPA: exosortase/archaeosortase family protein [Candidatus Sumerlaeota bacterium]|nr:exosortase/archaeosortase family protein [Candidatus Sumerlaeota bacterium]HPK01507.1 exosortase/archaeosortase family protein [Candidatus Sumerlaeota bacterium]